MVALSALQARWWWVGARTLCVHGASRDPSAAPSAIHSATPGSRPRARARFTKAD